MWSTCDIVLQINIKVKPKDNRTDQSVLWKAFKENKVWLCSVYKNMSQKSNKTNK